MGLKIVERILPCDMMNNECLQSLDIKFKATWETRMCPELSAKIQILLKWRPLLWGKAVSFCLWSSQMLVSLEKFTSRSRTTNAVLMTLSWEKFAFFVQLEPQFQFRKNYSVFKVKIVFIISGRLKSTSRYLN